MHSTERDGFGQNHMSYSTLDLRRSPESTTQPKIAISRLAQYR